MTNDPRRARPAGQRPSDDGSKEEVMPKGIPVSAEVDHVTHDAHYYVAGKKLVVISDYGEGGATLDGEPVERVAQRVLTGLIRRSAEQRKAMIRAHG
jgi:hypothetical protein